MPRPNFIVAGAARSGTTALAYALGGHPEVFVTEPKEMHFLAYATESPVFSGPGDSETMARSLITDPDEYAALFDGSEGFAARGEGSVSSLYRPSKALDSMAKYADPEAKAVVMLREPAARAHSSYLYLRSRGFEDLDTFEEALGAEEMRAELGYHHMWHLRGMSRYGQQLPFFAEALGDRLLILIQEEYVADQQGTLARVCEFLDVDSSFSFDTGQSVNRGGEPKSAVFQNISGALRSNPATQSLVKTLVPRKAREMIRVANLKRPEARPETMSSLRAEFDVDRRSVEEILGRRVLAWDAA